MVHISLWFMPMMLIYCEEAYIQMKEKAEPSIVARKEIGLEANTDMAKYMIMSRDQNVGRNLNMKIDNTSFAMAEQFKRLEQA
jgi:hypothetical protein